MDRRKKMVACAAAAHILLSMMVTVIASRKRKRDKRRRIGISYGPIDERDRVRMVYHNGKIWKSDTTCFDVVELLSFVFVKCLEPVGCLRTLFICVWSNK